MGTDLQRLFSTFPGSWPGLGLLLLRSCLGVVMAYSGIAGPSGNASGLIALAQNTIAIAGGACLVAGLWTPLVATLIAVDEVWLALSFPVRDPLWTTVLPAAVAASLAMLGPGAWSIDSLLFGRKRFNFNSRGR